PESGLVGLEEGQEDAGASLGRGVVERDLDRALVGGDLTVQPVGPPEGFVVDGEGLDDGSGGKALGELITPGRQDRVVDESTGERRRQGDDGPSTPENGAV